MNCRGFEQAFADTLNGQPASDPEGAAEHLRSCEACRDRARKIQRLHEALFRPEAAAPLAGRIKKAVGEIGRNLETVPDSVRAASHRGFQDLRLRRGRRMWAFVAVAGVLLLGVTLARVRVEPLPTASPTVQAPPPQKVREVPRPPERTEPPPIPRPPEKNALEHPPGRPLPEKPEPPKPEHEKPLPPEAAPPKKPVEVEVPKPKEEPPAPRKETLPAIAELDDVSGEVYVVSLGERRPVKEKAGLVPGDAVETAGPLALATVRFRDSTWLQLWGHTRLHGIVEDGGKRARLAAGDVTAAVAKQPYGRPFVFETPQGEARVVGTVLRLSVDSEGKGATRVEVEEGRVELKRSSDGRTVSVPAGHYAVAAPGVDLTAKLMFQDRNKPAAFPDVDQKKVDDAVREGVGWLKAAIAIGRIKDPIGEHRARFDELVLLTFLHAGVPENDPEFQKLFAAALEAELRGTYNVSLQAVLLDEMHRVKYQGRIVQCAQFLADNQAKDGQWSYGTPSPAVKGIPTGDRRPETGTAPTRRNPNLPVHLREKPKVVKRVPVRPTREGPAHGDPSNSQYAALGLRACHDAGVVFPVEMVKLAEKSWRAKQEKDGGWRYGGDPAPTGSMTAGAAGSLTILRYLLNEPWMKDEAVASGRNWLNENFSVTWNPGRAGAGPASSGTYFYYYLYAVERLGTLYGTETLGTHRWYAEGVKALLEAQHPNGMWQCRNAATNQVWDTCFAILFLRRATRPLVDVETLDRNKK